MDFYSTTGGNRKKLRSRGGSYAASSLTHMNRHNNKDAGKAKTETKPKQEKHMKTKQRDNLNINPTYIGCFSSLTAQ